MKSHSIRYWIINNMKRNHCTGVRNNESQESMRRTSFCILSTAVRVF